MIRRIIRTLGFIVALIIGVNLFLTFVCAPVYNFPEAKPFSGSNWHNPYEGLNPDHWKIGNFQIQSRLFGGVTNGRNNSSSRIFDMYGDLGYDVITISDYMTINTYCEDDYACIPMYEHGYGVQKTHQLVFDAPKVKYWDYPLIQTTNTKQFVLNMLGEDAAMTAIAHPKLRMAYTQCDMAKLCGYDLIESASNFTLSMQHWDYALSAGKPVYIISNDDAHDLDEPFDYGRMYTVMNCEEATKECVFSSLKSGHSYGVRKRTPSGETHALKVDRFKDLSVVNHVKLIGDSLNINFSHPVLFVTFYGQGGDTLKYIHHGERTSTVGYTTRPQDTYVRAEIYLANGDWVYLNPVFRYEDELPTVGTAEISWPKTLLYRGAFFIAFALVARYYFKRRKLRIAQ
jgi:hypothetical protein